MEGEARNFDRGGRAADLESKVDTLAATHGDGDVVRDRIGEAGGGGVHLVDTYVNVGKLIVARVAGLRFGRDASCGVREGDMSIRDRDAGRVANRANKGAIVVLGESWDSEQAGEGQSG